MKPQQLPYCYLEREIFSLNMTAMQNIVYGNNL